MTPEIIHQIWEGRKDSIPEQYKKFASIAEYEVLTNAISGIETFVVPVYIIYVTL
jgi:hypothetical protein